MYIHNLLSMKRFHGGCAGNAHKGLLKTSIGKVSEVLDNFLLSGNPVVLGVNSDGHFVVATGKTIDQNGKETYAINDPLSGKTTLDKYNNTYSSAKLFSGAPSDKRSLSVSAHSPIEQLITDPKGRRFGYDPVTGNFINEIPDAEYTLQSILANGVGPEQLPVSKYINIS